MALQTYFNKFHKTIKLDDTDENEELRNMRDNLLKKLNKGLDKLKENGVSTNFNYRNFNQGSYSMFTGIIPHKGEYDIDVGLKFNGLRTDFNDAFDLKKIVQNALELGGVNKNDISIKRPCLVVQCERKNINGDIENYHVDLAIYINEEDGYDKTVYLARGTYSGNSEWVKSTPELLRDKINEFSKGDFEADKKREQFRRIVRYLKKWASFKFKENGNDKPSGIGLTILAYNNLQNLKNDENIYDDILSLSHLIKKGILPKFISTFNEKYELEERIACKLESKTIMQDEKYLTIEPDSDFFKKMTGNQMKILKEQFEEMSKKLEEAQNELDEYESTRILKKLFGEDFPIQEEKSENREKVSGESFIGNSTSA